jgi:P4 family phage/plasmid primase-like protien
MGNRRSEITYDYTDAAGHLLFQVVRSVPKGFKARRPDPGSPGAWIHDINGVERVLFRLPEVIRAVSEGREVFLVEGEKDVLALVRNGFEATCNPFGAGPGKWQPSYSDILKGADVVIIADKDIKGRAHAQRVAARLAGKAKRIRIVEVPDTGGKPVKDSHDFFDAGGTAEQFRLLCATAQDWEASPMTSDENTGKLSDKAPGLASTTSMTATANTPHAQLENDYGSPFYENDRGAVISINERYWAGLFALENRALYDPDEKAFYSYNEARGLWQPITAAAIREKMSQRMLDVSRELELDSLEKQIRQTKLKGVIEALMGIIEKPHVFRSKKPFIHVANGVIRFTEDNDIQFGGFSPYDFSRNQSPFTFDDKAECPRFLLELIYPAVSTEDAELLQQWAGLALFGYNLPQRFLILSGMPNGGKGTFVRIIQALVGVENTYQLRTECLAERFETFHYRGKTLLIGPDVPGDFLMHRAASALKVLVGGDPISAEGKGLNGDFQMFGTFNIVMTCNSRLRIRLDGDHGAWRRRLLVISYEKPPPATRVLDFDRLLLREESSGILLWAVKGFAKANQDFTQIGDFVLTDKQQQRTDSLLAESDSLRLFVREWVVQQPGRDMTTAEFQQGYAEYCAEKAWNPLPGAIVARQADDLMLELLRAPKAHSIERDGRKSNRGWRNVEMLKPEETLWD